MWRELTEDDLASAVHGHELEAWRERALAEGQADPLPVVQRQVVLLMREAIRSHADNRLSDDANELPEAAIYHAVTLIRHRLAERFSEVEDIGEARKLSYRSALEYLDAVRTGKQAVERWTGAEDDPRPVARPSIKGRGRRFSDADQDGI